MPVHGDSLNTAVWGGADVLIGSITATIPVGNAAFTFNETSGGTAGVTTQWDYVGILDPGQGFSETIETEETEHRGWGWGVIATTYGGQSLTRTFTTLEENLTVLGLTYDASDLTDSGTDISGDLGVKDFTERVRIAFVTYSGDEERRLISKNYATVAASGGGSESEEALMTRGFTATIYPDTNNKLWAYYRGASL